MRPKDLKTRMFLDGGDPEKSKDIMNKMGFLDGQTTNPTLISKNPEVKKRLEKGEKFTEGEALRFYKDVVGRISELIPEGSISIEVYADPDSRAEELLKQGREMFSWIPNAQVKFPCSKAGLTAAEQAVKEGMRVNMTLCFRQEQAAAVYAATRGARKGQVYVSPFIGRLDDRGENGMDLIANIVKMFREGDGHVDVLTASVRKLDHVLCALNLRSDILTAPFEILEEWTGEGLPIPGPDYRYDPGDLREIPYKQLDLNKNWQEFDISHELTTRGMEKFSEDWNGITRR